MKKIVGQFSKMYNTCKGIAHVGANRMYKFGQVMVVCYRDM